ncbi:hypothetical protein SAMN05519104_5403 [Rhizobiales bacterium GAS188]|nr:hypothetical protein SAMN05519104_5403 [Rhizobiales bacterium GAS188]
MPRAFPRERCESRHVSIGSASSPLVPLRKGGGHPPFRHLSSPLLGDHREVNGFEDNSGSSQTRLATLLISASPCASAGRLGRSGQLNISAYPPENFAGVTILQNAETIGHLLHVDVLEMGVSPGFCLSKARCLYDDRLDDNRVAVVGRQPDEFNLIPRHHGTKCRSEGSWSFADPPVGDEPLHDLVRIGLSFAHCRERFFRMIARYPIFANAPAVAAHTLFNVQLDIDRERVLFSHAANMPPGEQGRQRRNPPALFKPAHYRVLTSPTRTEWELEPQSRHGLHGAK